MQQPSEFRKMMTLLESFEQVDEKFQRPHMDGRNPVRDVVSHKPIPYRDSATSKNKDDHEWLLGAALSGLKTKKVYMDPENNKISMFVGYSPKEKAYVYIPDNTAQTLGFVNAKRIREMLKAIGLRDGKDFVVDQVNSVVKVRKSDKFENSGIPH